MELERLLHILEVLRNEAPRSNDEYMKGWQDGWNAALEVVAKQAKLEDVVFAGYRPPAVERVADMGDHFMYGNER